MTHVPQLQELGFGLSFTPDQPKPLEPVILFDPTERTELAVKSLTSLGLVLDSAKASDEIGQGMQSLHDRLVATHTEDSPQYEPHVGLVLADGFTFQALVARFDQKQTQASLYDGPIWSQYQTADLNRRTISGADIPKPEVRAMLLGGDHLAENGLYHVGKNYQDQRSAIAEHELVNPVDYLIINAQRREAGETLLDPETFTRFVQLAMVTARGGSWVGDAYSRQGRLWLRRSHGLGSGDAGVRLSMGQEMPEAS